MITSPVVSNSHTVTASAICQVRAKDAPIETAKFMGHGVCDNIAKSVSLSLSTSSADIIERETLGLLKQIKNPPQDFRDQVLCQALKKFA
ncbi:DNA repair protein REV1 [Portunus trituberculatus]|uniref:DNA repair protein REV1 n=1 Tax=Portunus trituberculatus TaxID=210409 RepID=A0A5B7GXL0_PORTR|nr:DNA repair protein REV1 [Portunus trituberculatus]